MRIAPGGHWLASVTVARPTRWNGTCLGSLRTRRRSVTVNWLGRDLRGWRRTQTGHLTVHNCGRLRIMVGRYPA